MGLGLNTTQTQRRTSQVEGSTADGVQKPNDSKLVVKYETPDAPRQTPIKTETAKPMAASAPSMLGFFKPVVASTLIAATLVSGCASHGARVDATPDLTQPPAYEQVVETPANPSPGRAVAQFNHDLMRLERMVSEGEITTDQMAAAREVLYRARILDLTQNVPRDEQGRITLESVLRGDPAQIEQQQTRGQVVMDQLTRDIERRMRITARDMATGDFTPVDGLPGYKEIPADQVRRLFTRAMKRVPIGELPFGVQLTQVLQNVPGLDDVNVGSMTFEELRREVRDDAKDYLDARFGDFVDDHKIEVGVVAFAAVTGLRAASPEAADLMDGLGLRVDAWKERSEDGRLQTRGRLVWRDQHVLPDLDVEGQAHTQLGDHWTLRGHIRGTASIEAEDHFTGTATVGAHYAQGDLWLDTAGTYTFPEDTWRASVTGGYTDPDTSFRASGGLHTTFGDGVAQGDAEGRGSLQIDLGQEFDFGRDVTGYWGFYGGVSADTDMENKDVGVGVVFRLDF